MRKSKVQHIKAKAKPYFSNRLTDALANLMDAIYENDQDRTCVNLGKIIELINITKSAHKQGKNVLVIATGKMYGERGNLI